MQFITVRKSESFNVKSPIKVYDLERNGVAVGTLQTWGRTWQVLDAYLNEVASHTTIKAAVRSAGKIL